MAEVTEHMKIELQQLIENRTKVLEEFLANSGAKESGEK
jgi:hypothetical protein